jgi:enediyne biosynthesis protein E4
MRIAARASLATLAVFAAGAAFSAERVTGDVPDYVDEAADAGINHVYAGPWEFFVGGGVAAFDCNGDRKPDLFMAGGSNPAELFENESETGGALRFKPVVLSGLDPGDLKRVIGVYPLDIDNDGHMDLFVLRLGANLLLKGDGDCQFTKANDAWAFDGGREWTTAFSATFETGAKFPTLAIGNYVDRQAPGSPWGTCGKNYLIRASAGDTPSYGAPFTLTPGYCTLSMLFTDWNQSGTPSLRVTNDRQYYRGGEEQMWRVDPGRTPQLFTSADGWQHLSIWGMGIAEADLSGNGYPEYALTSMGDTKLQELDPEEDEGDDGLKPVYKDIAFDVGATAQRPYQGTDYRPSTGWHSEFADVNNDGQLDLFISKGNVESMPEFAAYDPDNLLLGGWDGNFTEVGGQAGVASEKRGRGAAVVDLNLDGMLDIVVVNRNSPASLFRNLGARTAWGHEPLGNWLEVELAQPDANRNAVGARISVKLGNQTMTRVISVGGGHASGQAGFVHFGLGTAERAEIRIKWPDGEWSHTYKAFADNFVRIERGKPAASYWLPPPPAETTQ